MEKKNYIVAIDLGSSNVVVAVAERDAEGRPAVRSIVSKPSQGVKAGMITNIEQVSNSIKAAVEAVGEELGIRITEAYTGISGDFVRCARHTDHVFTSDPQNGVNRTDVEALFDRMRNVQAPDDETIMERIPQNYLVDENQEVADPVGSFGKRLASTFNFILCAKTPIERLNLALRRLGIRSLGMYANALVTGAAVLSADEKEEGAAVVNIGGGVTDIPRQGGAAQPAGPTIPRATPYSAGKPATGVSAAPYTPRPAAAPTPPPTTPAANAATEGAAQGAAAETAETPHRPKRGLLDKLKQKLGTRLDDFFTGSEDEEI